MNLLQGNSLGDVSLDAIAVMAQAQAENGGNNCTFRAITNDSGTRSGHYQVYNGSTYQSCYWSYNYSSTECICTGGTLCCTPSFTCSNGYDSCGGDPCK